MLTPGYATNYSPMLKPPEIGRQRSKSQASEMRVGAECRKPDSRRPPPNVETVDSSTQTDGDDMDIDANVDATDIEENDEGVEGAGAGGPPAGFLSKVDSITAELEMAVRSQMEKLAGHEGGARAGGRGPAPPSVGRGSSNSHFHGRRLRLPKPAGEEGSDGEGPDDEVRSLSLSEDGPVCIMKRSISEPCHQLYDSGRIASRVRVHAPDPIAMLTDGQRKGTDRPHGGGPPLPIRSRSYSNVEERCFLSDLGLERQASGERPLINHALGALGDDIDGEPIGSDTSAPSNPTNESAAPTQRGPRSGESGEEEKLQSSISSLIPVLEKVTAQTTLEVVQEGPGLPGSGSMRAMPSLGKRASRVHVPARKDVRALDLSDLRDKGGLERGQAAGPRQAGRDLDTRSDVSFGSAQSAFECYSSSSSQLNSPQHQDVRAELKATVSMPLLSSHKR